MTLAVLVTFTAQATVDELRSVASYIGECIARGDTAAVMPFRNRACQLRLQAHAETWLYGFTDTLVTFIDAYLAEVER